MTPPQDGGAGRERRSFGETLDLHITEEPVRARDARPGQEVRAGGWGDHHVVLCVEPQRHGYVCIRWRCDAGDHPPHAYTMFEGSEWLAVKP